jgi:hypothetical protein
MLEWVAPGQLIHERQVLPNGQNPPLDAHLTSDRGGGISWP